MFHSKHCWDSQPTPCSLSHWDIIKRADPQGCGTADPTTYRRTESKRDKPLSVSPLGSIEAVPEVPEDRDRILNDKEIKAFWDSCVEGHYPFGYLFQLLLLTGARREERGQLRWHEIDLDKATLLLPKERTKNSS